MTLIMLVSKKGSCSDRSGMGVVYDLGNSLDSFLES